MYAAPHEARSHGAATSTPGTYNLARTRELRLHSPMVTCVERPPNEDRPLLIADNHDATTFHAREMLHPEAIGDETVHHFGLSEVMLWPLDARDVNI
jgi:hypothetical protein